MKTLVFCGVIWMAMALSPARSMAAGFGFYLDGGIGSGQVEWDSDVDSFDVDASSWGGGFVLDTSPGDEKTFNYRLLVGVERQDLEDDHGITMKMVGLSVENVFGFALVKTPEFRWWAGPLVRIGFYHGETDTDHLSSGVIKSEADLLELGVGAVTGINFKLGNVHLAPSLGVRFIGAGGSGTRTYSSSFGRYHEDDDLSARATIGFANLALLF